jgi:hypothetical protein
MWMTCYHWFKELKGGWFLLLIFLIKLGDGELSVISSPHILHECHQTHTNNIKDD